MCSVAGGDQSLRRRDDPGTRGMQGLALKRSDVRSRGVRPWRWVGPRRQEGPPRAAAGPLCAL